MNKQNLIIGIVVLVALVGGVVLWQQKNNQENTKQQTNKEITKQTQEQKTTRKQETKEQTNDQNQTGNGELKPEEKIDTSSWKTYLNKEFGFEVKLPGDLNKWNIKIEKYDNKDDGYPGRLYRIWFNYPLDKPVLQVASDPNSGYIHNVNIWYLDAVLTKNYVDNICDKYPHPKCYQGKVLGRNNKYVFVSGLYNIQGAEYLCQDYKQEEQEFCRILRPFSSISQFNSAIQFKIF